MRVSAVAAPEKLRTAYEKTFPLAGSYKVQARPRRGARASAAGSVCAAACAWALDCPLKVPAACAWRRPQPLALCPRQPAGSIWCCPLLAVRPHNLYEASRRAEGAALSLCEHCVVLRMRTAPRNMPLRQAGHSAPCTGAAGGGRGRRPARAAVDQPPGPPGAALGRGGRRRLPRRLAPAGRRCLARRHRGVQGARAADALAVRPGGVALKQGRVRVLPPGDTARQPAPAWCHRRRGTEPG